MTGPTRAGPPRSGRARRRRCDRHVLRTRGAGRAHPALFERVKDAGHEVEVHGYEHLRHPHVMRAEVEARLDRRWTCIGGATKWRIPWGHLADFTPNSRASAAGDRGLDTDTHDWRGDPAERCSRLELERGGIVLAHDGISVGRNATRRGRPHGSSRCWSRRREQGPTPGPLDDIGRSDPDRESAFHPG